MNAVAECLAVIEQKDNSAETKENGSEELLEIITYKKMNPSSLGLKTIWEDSIFKRR